ncbi:MAG: tRNA (adenosine(37)-N6)-threonylcarbamoyltransferase complex transferase subunit TsaD [Patescibacteria group bacterium]
MRSKMKILAIETSCDETAVSILKAEGDILDPRFCFLADITLSQTDIHSQYGGVFPSLAKREHSENIIPLLKKTIKEAGIDHKKKEITKDLKELFSDIFTHEEKLDKKMSDFIEEYGTPDIDAIAITQGPGLEPALWVGINVAKALSISWNKPLIPVNHLEGHIASVLFNKEHNKENKPPETPSLALIISGGHTECIKVKKWGDYQYLGGTVDDAVGEAFDKVARMLDLPYPGGPPLSDLAQKSREKGEKNPFTFPRPMKDSNDLNFSFSGLKTAVLYSVKGKELTEREKEFVAEAFEDAVVDTLKIKVKKALKEGAFKSLVLCGGVSANQYIRSQFQDLAHELSISLLIPDQGLSTDNASMIAITGFLITKTRPREIIEEKKEILELKACGNIGLGN